MPDGIRATSSADLTNLCLPWDNDEGGLLAKSGIAAPRECMVPHPVISPEAMWDDDRNVTPLEIPGQTIEVHGKAPPESPLASAVRRGIAEIPSKDQFEKSLLRQANHFAKDWSIERWHHYIQGPAPEGFTEPQKFEWQKAATHWQEYVTQAYSQAWDRAEAKLLDNYRRIDVANSAVKSNLKFQLAGTFFAVVPAAGAIYGGWTAGVSGVEAATGRNSGMQVSDLVAGKWADHRKLSTPERIGRGAEAGLGALTMASGYAMERSAAASPRAVSNSGVVSGEIVSRKAPKAPPHAPAEPKVIVDRSAYTVEPGQAGMSKALGLDPSKTRAMAHASDGHGADFHVVASPGRPSAPGTGDPPSTLSTVRFKLPNSNDPERIIAVKDGKAYYVSTGGSPSRELDGTTHFKTAGTVSEIRGVQREPFVGVKWHSDPHAVDPSNRSVAQIENVTEGWLIKGPGFTSDANASVAGLPPTGLRAGQLPPPLRTITSVDELNQWLASKGATPMTDARPTFDRHGFAILPPPPWMPEPPRGGGNSAGR